MRFPGYVISLEVRTARRFKLLMTVQSAGVKFFWSAVIFNVVASFIINIYDAHIFLLIVSIRLEQISEHY